MRGDEDADGEPEREGTAPVALDVELGDMLTDAEANGLAVDDAQIDALDVTATVRDVTAVPLGVIVVVAHAVIVELEDGDEIALGVAPELTLAADDADADGVVKLVADPALLADADALGALDTLSAALADGLPDGRPLGVARALAELLDGRDGRVEAGLERTSGPRGADAAGVLVEEEQCGGELDLWGEGRCSEHLHAGAMRLRA